MKKILVLPEAQFLAHTTRPLEIAIKLRDIGIKVLVAGEGKYIDLFKNAGFECLLLKGLDNIKSLNILRKGRLNVWKEKLYEQSVLKELELFSEVRPDAVLTDFKLTAKTSCELAKIPQIAIMNATWTPHYNNRFKAPENFAITKILGKNITTKLMPVLKNILINLDASEINKVRRRLGLKKYISLLECICGDLNLIVDIPEYSPIKNIPKNFYYVGPLVWSPNINIPDWYYSLDDEKKTIYFTVGSTGTLDFIEHALDMYGGNDDQFLVTTGGIGELSVKKKNFFVTDIAPGDKLLQKSNAVVCHGGNGTIYQALSKGVPIIGIPSMHDQEFNMHRVEELGVGISLSNLRFKREHLDSAINEVLNNERYKKNALYYQNIITSYDASTLSAHIISKFIGWNLNSKICMLASTLYI